jgi:predicted fused transcriptional regulator/phosphomethylpyrimidine kinase
LELRSEQRAVAGVEKALAEVDAVSYALVDLGGHRIESITYVFDESALLLAEKAEQIARIVV